MELDLQLYKFSYGALKVVKYLNMMACVFLVLISDAITPLLVHLNIMMFFLFINTLMEQHAQHKINNYYK